MGFTVVAQLDGIECTDKKGRLLSYILPEKMMHLADKPKDPLFVNKMMHYQWWTMERIFYQKKFTKFFR